MERKEFVFFRKKLEKSQVQMARLLGVSIKAVHSYEQGWREIPAHAERQILFLVAMSRNSNLQKPCWIMKRCPTEKKKLCPAWEFRAGKLCWFINGTICHGVPCNNWKEKIKICRSCEALISVIGDSSAPAETV